MTEAVSALPVIVISEREEGKRKKRKRKTSTGPSQILLFEHLQLFVSFQVL